MKESPICHSCGAPVPEIAFRTNWSERAFNASIIFVAFSFLLAGIGFYTRFMMTKAVEKTQTQGAGLVIENTEYRNTPDKQAILCSIRNDGTSAWQQITLQADFFDKSGKPVDTMQDYFFGLLEPGAKRLFKLSFSDHYGKSRIVDFSTYKVAIVYCTHL